MTVQEIMERSGITQTNMTIAFIKDAINLLQSQTGENIKDYKRDIIDGIKEYHFPPDIIAIKSISVLDTSDNKYKKIRRLSNSPLVSEDTDPE